MNPLFKQLVQQALGYLAIRNRSELEIRQYLAKKTSDSSLIDQVLAYLEAHGLIDDTNFGNQWVESRVKHQKGDIQISQELKIKGLSLEKIHQIVDCVSQADWFDAMALLINKKNNKYCHLNSFQKKAKIYQLLSQHGYSSKLIDAFLRRGVE